MIVDERKIGIPARHETARCRKCNGDFEARRLRRDGATRIPANQNPENQARRTRFVFQVVGVSAGKNRLRREMNCQMNESNSSANTSCILTSADGSASLSNASLQLLAAISGSTTSRTYRVWTFHDKIYIAKFYEFDGCVALADALDVRHSDIILQYKQILRNGKLETYKRYWDNIHKGV